MPRVDILQKRLTENNSTLTTATAPLPYSSTKCRLDTTKFPRWFESPIGTARIIANADGKPNPVLEAEVLAEIAEADTAGA